MKQHGPWAREAELLLFVRWSQKATRMSKDSKGRSPKAKHVIAGLDIGTTKAIFAIGIIGAEGLEVVGLGSAPNPGMRHGVIVNIEAATEAIKKAREEAELMAGFSVNSVWVTVGGTHIQSFASAGMVAVSNEEIANEDVLRVIEAAKAVAIPTDRQVLHVLPSEFRIDGQDGISDPIGMSGVRLEASVHIVTGSRSALQNTLRCLERSGLASSGFVLSQLASARAVLSSDEKNLGVTLVDIGGGTCDIITFLQGSVVHTAVIPVGGNNFTHDVAMGLRTTQAHAEMLKRKYGSALPDMVEDNETIEVEGVGGRQSRTVSRRYLCEILEARAEETLSLIRGELADSSFVGRLGSGVVLTGGGSLLAGLVEMGDFIFDIPVRRGVPSRVGGLTDVVRCSSHASAVGLLMYGMDQEKPKAGSLEKNHDNLFTARVEGWTKRLKELFGGSL